ncbi:MAG: hypothetical protein IJ761_04530 [Bacteroidales bacterium]|nr:hypothetical protein [Bacteroidales bacterium]
MNRTSVATKATLAITAFLMLAGHGLSQVKLSPDTLQCYIIGFNAGIMTPISGLHSNSQGYEGGNMADLYKSPYLDFALECDYKYQSNWLLTFDADFWFGLTSDNLKDRTERMGDVFTSTGYAMSWGGYDGAMTFYNRGLALRGGGGKIIPVNHKNPNSGLLLKLSGGWFLQQTKMVQDVNESPVPQLSGDYARLYDHLRHGLILTESFGFWYMNNYRTYVNFRITFDISQCYSWSARPYIIDNKMGLNGKDNSRYFDLLCAVKLTWMFPLTGKTTYDYYYY